MHVHWTDEQENKPYMYVHVPPTVGLEDQTCAYSVRGAPEGQSAGDALSILHPKCAAVEAVEEKECNTS